MYPKILITILVLLFLNEASAQSPFIREFTDRDGLSGMNVYRILQDDNGLIWIATDNGICYFDGTDFKKVNHPKVKDLDFVGMNQGPFGRIWCFNWAGQVFYINKTKLEYFSPDGYLDNVVVREIVEDKKGNVWIVSNVVDEKIIGFDKERKLIVRDRFNPSEYISFIKDLENNNRNPIKLNLGMTTSNLKIKPINKKLGVRVMYSEIGGYHPKIGALFLNNTNVLKAIDFKNDTFLFKEILRIPKGEIIRDFYEDSKGQSWVFSKAKTFLFSKNNEDISENITFLKNKVINIILEDNNGGFWMGTRGNGLLYIPNIDFINLNTNNSKIPSENITSIKKIADENIVVTTHSGNIFLLNDKINVLNNRKYSDITFLYKRPDKDGYWAQTSKGVLLLDKAFNSKQSFMYGSVKSFYEKADTLLIGKTTGAFKIFLDENKQYPISAAARIEVTPNLTVFKNNKSPVYSIIEVQKKTYIGRTNGLHFLNSNNEIQGPILFSKEEKWNTSWIQEMKFHNGILWLVTNKGLFGLKDEKLHYSFTVENGLSDDNCKHLEFDGDNQIWLGTNKGLNIININNNQIQVIGLSDGLPSNRITALELDETTVWVGTPRGIVYFDKKEILKQKMLLPVIITNIQIDNKDTIIRTSYDLNYRNNDIVLEYTSPTFDEQNGLTYYYRLVNFNNNWIATKSKTIPYTNLPSGNYKFEIYVTDEQGNKSSVTSNLSISISVPFWKRWWFYILELLIGAGFISIITFALLNRVRKQKEKEINFRRELSESKMQALQSQMNPHFIFNALNAIQHFFTTNSKEKAIKHLNRFAQLIRFIFEYSKETTIPLYKEIEFLKLYVDLESLRFGDKVQINFEVDEAIILDDVILPPLLIQPMIENVFKHGLLHKETTGHLDVIFKKIKDDEISCTIVDDGIGREAAKKHTKWRMKEHRSSGLKNTIERISLYNIEYPNNRINFSITDLKDENGKAAGTKVEFVIKTAIEE